MPSDIIDNENISTYLCRLMEHACNVFLLILQPLSGFVGLRTGIFSFCFPVLNFFPAQRQGGQGVLSEHAGAFYLPQKEHDMDLKPVVLGARKERLVRLRAPGRQVTAVSGL